MRGDSHIGVSLQTLDDKAFDHGTILAQTEPPGFAIPPQATLQEMTAMLAKEGAKMLVQSLREGLHMPPHEQVPWFPAETESQHGHHLSHAPKVTKADSEVRWDAWAHEDFARRARVFGWLWTAVGAGDGSARRVLIQEPEVLFPTTASRQHHDDTSTTGTTTTGSTMDSSNGAQGKSKSKKSRRITQATLPFVMEGGQVFTGGVELDQESGTVDVSLRNGAVVRLRTVKVAGQPEKPAAVALRPFLLT
jgi:methionyl-tRNA formyltransferase